MFGLIALLTALLASQAATPGSADNPGLLKDLAAADSLAQQRKFGESIKLMDRAIARSPQSSFAIAKRGMVRVWSGDSARALQDFKDALRLNPDELMAHRGLSLMYVKQGRWTEATLSATNANRLDPADIAVLMVRAESRRQLGEFAAAISDLDEVLRLNPVAYDARFMKAQALLADRKAADVLRETDALLKQRPGDPDILFLRASALSLTQHREAALEAFTDLIAVRPGADVYIGRAQTWGPEARKQALADLDAAAKLSPRSDGPARIKAGFAFTDGEFDASVAILGELLKTAPKDVWALRLRSAAHRRAGRRDLALADISRVIELVPASAQDLNARCWIRATWGLDLNLALADCDASLGLQADYAPALDSRGLVRLRLGQIDPAIADYDAALKLRPDQADSLFGRGLAKMRKGDGRGGEADLAQARRLNPEIDNVFAAYGVKP